MTIADDETGQIGARAMLNRRSDDWFILPVYRRAKYPGETVLKPFFILHFYEVPANPSERMKSL